MVFLRAYRRPMGVRPRMGHGTKLATSLGRSSHDGTQVLDRTNRSLLLPNNSCCDDVVTLTRTLELCKRRISLTLVFLFEATFQRSAIAQIRLIFTIAVKGIQSFSCF